MNSPICIKRAYESAASDDGFRVLIDRLWPRGVSKENLKHDMWCKDLAPSAELRKWFGHKVENWDKFQTDYKKELNTDLAHKHMGEIIKAAKGKKITLLFGAKDEEHNQAVVLAKVMADYAKEHDIK